MVEKSDMDQLQQVVEYIASGLVDRPEEVHVDSRRHGPNVSLHLRVAEDELGRVIGKGGRIAKAMRTMVGIVAARQGLRANLEIEG
jgi:hypothetical protein